MSDRFSAAVGLVAVAALAWGGPRLVRWVCGPAVPRSAPVVYALPGSVDALLWGPVGVVPVGADGRQWAPGEGPDGPVDGWRGLLLGVPLDLDRATLEDLDALPGVGPATAGRILELRDRLGAPLQPDDLLAVRGIGPRTLDRLRPYLSPPRP